MGTDLLWNQPREFGFGPYDPMWDERGSFNLQEISYLLYGSSLGPYMDEMKRSLVQESIENNTKLMLTSLVSGEFTHSNAKRFNDTYILSKPAIASWFEFIGEPCPTRFKSKNKVKRLPTYLDPQHDDFCPEMQLALDICDAIYVDNKGVSSLSNSKKVERYLDHNYELNDGSKTNLPAAFVERMKVVCTAKETKIKKIDSGK